MKLQLKKTEVKTPTFHNASLLVAYGWKRAFE